MAVVVVLVVVYLSICKLENEAILRDILSFWTWQRQKRSTSARLPPFSNLTTSKVESETILRDFLTVRTWQYQKRSNSARLPSKNCKLSAELTASYQCVLRFFQSICLKHAPAMKKWGQVIRSAAPVTQNHLGKPVRESPPRTPNTSNSCVSCTAPAARNASFQILFKCPTAAIVFETAKKPARFAHFWPGAGSLVPATQNDIRTSKSALYPSVFCTFDFEVCFALQRRALFRHLNFQKCSETVRFYTFDFEMCFAPQRRALFRHVNFQKWSENGVLYTFWLGNVLRAITACTFSTCQLPKVVREWFALHILAWTCASRDNGVQFLIAPHPRL